MMGMRVEIPGTPGEITWAMGARAKKAILDATKTQTEDDRMWTAIADRYDEDELNRHGSGYDARKIHETRARYTTEGAWSRKITSNEGWIHYLEEGNANLAMRITDLEKELEGYRRRERIYREELDIWSDKHDIQSLTV